MRNVLICGAEHVDYRSIQAEVKKRLQGSPSYQMKKIRGMLPLVLDSKGKIYRIMTLVLMHYI